jgi:hypothetical protein
MKPEQVIRDRCSNRVGCIVDNGQQLVVSLRAKSPTCLRLKITRL